MNSKGVAKEDLDMIIDSLHDYIEANLPDEKLLQLDHDDEFPEAIIKEMMSPDGLGIHLLFIDEDCEGMGGGAFDNYRVCEQLARCDIGVATGVLATFLGADPIIFGGTDEQRKRFMTRVAVDGLIMAYGATEPEAGSDLGALRTVAVPVEEDGKVVGYRITGNKQWISNGGYADLYTILAKTPGGPSWFVVERETEGFSQGKQEDKHGIRASNTTTLTLEDCYVEADRLLGDKEGLGLMQAQLVFGFTRLMVAAFGLGGGWSNIDRAIPYSTERTVQGSPLSEKQGYTHKLIVPNVCRLEAARAFIEETAERIDDTGGKLNTEGAIAKYLATEFGNKAADDAIQALGGYGYTKEYMVEKMKRDVRITQIYEGTSEIMEMTIYRDRWQEHLKTRGQHYHTQAKELEALHAKHPDVGANVAAKCNHALADVLETSREKRLTRNQHVMFRMGELIAYAEGAGAMARRAARAKEGKLSDKADKRFKPEVQAVISRVFAREAAAKVAYDGVRWVASAPGFTAADASVLQGKVDLTGIMAMQGGNLDDMDYVADVLYERK